MRLDLTMWREFLQNQSVYCRNFGDFSRCITYKEIQFAMDASRNGSLGFSGHCGTSWMQASWSGLIEKLQPSIEYLELLALVAGFMAWAERFKNRKIILYSDNMSVCYMVNRTSSSCKNCMVLIRKLVLHSRIHNVKVKAEHVPSHANQIADSLSRFNTARFNKVTKAAGLIMEKEPTQVPSSIWPF